MKFIPSSVTRAAARSVLQAKKNAPHIFFAAGVAGVVGSTVLACKATLKLERTMEDIRNDVATVKELGASSNRERVGYTDKAYNRDLGYVYGRGALAMGKLYGPALVLGTLSIAALTGSHVTLVRRNAAISATLAGVSKMLEDYRTRVKASLGEEKELDIYQDVKEVHYEDGGKKRVDKIPEHGFSLYAKCFDSFNYNWKNDPEWNRIFLQAAQNAANNRLKDRGHLFLNEVYRDLGFEDTTAGALCGWVYNGNGDNFVDFGLSDPKSSRFVNNLEPCIWLDFNVDGEIFRLI